MRAAAVAALLCFTTAARAEVPAFAEKVRAPDAATTFTKDDPNSIYASSDPPLRQYSFPAGVASLACVGIGIFFRTQLTDAVDAWKKSDSQATWVANRAQTESALVRTNLAFTGAVLFAATSAAFYFIKF